MSAEREEPPSDSRPEVIVVAVRAVCGFLAGLFVAGVMWLTYFSDAGRFLTILWFMAWPVAFAYAAVRWGDAFWGRWIRNPFWS